MEDLIKLELDLPKNKGLFVSFFEKTEQEVFFASSDGFFKD